MPRNSKWHEEVRVISIDIPTIAMSFSAAKFTSATLWLFVALLQFGWAQNVANNSLMKGVHITTSGSTFPRTIATQIPATMPEYVRRRRASSAPRTSLCFTPPQPVNGEYKLDRYFCDGITDCEISEGTALEPGSQLVYRCNPGYRAKGNMEVFCKTGGKWSAIPECIEVTCDSLNSVSTMVSCTRFGKWVNCDSPVPPDTRAEVACRRGYTKDTDFITTRRGVVDCNIDGKWEPQPIRCVPVCGVTIPHQQPFVSGGRAAIIGDFPWHASLFFQVDSPTTSKKVYLCGATIIQTNLVLTAAHCVYDERTKTTQDPGKLFVMTGNVFRDYDSPVHNPEVVRKATVKNVYMFCNYYGLSGNYVSDIALVELKQPFEFSSIVLPACLDDSGYSEQFLEPGVQGRVAGFGRTDTGKASGILQTITVPYVSYSQCKASNKDSRNEVFISTDKFCAGYTNGSAVCEGDSGGGLVFKKGDLWYVMGIVSVGLGVDVDSGEKTCDKNAYSLYTKVSTYMTWIQDVLFYVERDQKYHSCNHDNMQTSTRTSAPSTAMSQPTTTQSIGNSCSLTNGSPGVCTLLKNCQSVLSELKAGRSAYKKCGLSGLEPIVCCPSSTPEITTPSLPVETRTFVGDDGRGAIARQKCMEYSQRVVASKCSSFVDANQQLANVSVSTGKTRAERKEFPHMAAIAFQLNAGSNGWYCGGTLISEIFVLTSAACTTSSSLGPATWVRLGAVNLARPDDGSRPEDRRIIERILHPGYKLPSHYHDIALLRLDSRVPFNDWIRPACLHTEPTTRIQEAIATGWGRVDWDAYDQPDDLHKVKVPLVDAETCNASWTSPGFKASFPEGIVGDWMICAGRKGRDTCKGDGGGPLFIPSEDKYHSCMYDVIGITSQGQLCGVAGIPAIYTSVYHYISWIESTVWSKG